MQFNPEVAKGAFQSAECGWAWAVWFLTLHAPWYHFLQALVLQDDFGFRLLYGSWEILSSAELKVRLKSLPRGGLAAQVVAAN
jgi:hypothetical protein